MSIFSDPRLDEFLKVKKLADNTYCINKPLGISSFMVVNIFKQFTNAYKVGHAGTLDPLATGALVVLLNNATKNSNLYMASKKTYIFDLLLGVSSPSGDLETQLELSDSAVPVTEDLLIPVLHDFIGKHKWQVGKYSALKKSGRKLYKSEGIFKIKEMEIFELRPDKLEEFTGDRLLLDVSRRLEEVEHNFSSLQNMGLRLSSKNISLLENLKEALNRAKNFFNKYRNDIFHKVTLEAQVSKGTYIRVLARKIGERLGTNGLAFAIHRKCTYNIEN